ncbi:putative deoxyribonuclease TATDN1 [Vitis vinifera]|uniref:Putative deoxyribonuclease TATDN1 n=1 Tax=Vitis vinifera TaxID=29760 RepID=A0A438GLD6_VITVI|nr:putative deoxyribonuclease TATDN1 [Vitis vinifera]
MFKGIYNGKQCHVSDLAAVLSRAWSAGVDRIIVTGGSLEESKEALAIAETDGVCLYLIVFPIFVLLSEGFSVQWGCTQPDAKLIIFLRAPLEFEDSGDPDNHFLDLMSLAKEGVAKGKVVAIGECGLDYDRLHFCPSEVQKKYFEKQFELAYAMKLPMFLHMRAAAEDFCDILGRNMDRFGGGVAHSFTGSAEDCNKLLSFNNLFIGVNGCSLKTAENLEVVRGIPVERLMIETDSPYCEIKNTHAGINFVKSLWPSKKKEKYEQECIVKGRNEPCLVRDLTCMVYSRLSDLSSQYWQLVSSRQVLEVVAGCKGVSDIEQLSKTLYNNTCRVFFPQDLDSAADALLAGSHGTK